MLIGDDKDADNVGTTKADQIRQQIEELIVVGELPAGRVLRQDDLAKGVLAVDMVGMATYALPVVGEGFDVFWAPIAAVTNWAVNRGVIGLAGGAATFAEEILPGTDFIPSLTMTWWVTYVLGKDTAFEQYVARHRSGGSWISASRPRCTSTGCSSPRNRWCANILPPTFPPTSRPTAPKCRTAWPISSR